MNRYHNGMEPIPGYKIVDFLGEGSYGAVYKTRGPGGVENALKFISLDNKQGLKEFKSVSLVKKLRHANLVPIFAIWLRDSNGNVMDETSGGDSGSINLMGNKELVIAMGLGDKSLTQQLEEMHGQGIAVDKLLRYMEDAAKGIDYLNEPTHEPNSSSIIHCDIKPGNLLIVGGSVQVCDYGVARALSKKVDLKKTMGAGTPAYAAPELINNDPTTQTDQYSLAITYIELRTGSLPFDETKALVSNLTGRLDLTKLPPAEQQVILRATHMQPGKRYPTCQEMIEDMKVAAGLSLGRTGAVPASASRRHVATEEFTPQRSIDDLLQKGEMLVPEHRLVRRLGEGGYGQVWEARGPFDTPCALKIVRRTENRGQQEYEILSKIKNISHRHLMEPLEIWLLAADGSRVRGERVGQPDAPQPAAVVIKTKLADKNLFERMRECQSHGMDGVAPTELLQYMHQSAAAIDHLNNNNIQHRDIKPENILLLGDQAFVSDFGLAKLVDDSGTATQSSSSGMTMDYAAPELLEDKRVTLWTDQYSLALTYIMLRTGRLPYPAHASPSQKIQARLTGQLDLSAVSPGEREVLIVALDREPGKRYDNCAAMVSKLGSAVGLGSGPFGLAGSGLQAPLVGSGTYPPLPARGSSADFERRSGPMPIGGSRPLLAQEELVMLAAERTSRHFVGTVNFGSSDTAPLQSHPARASASNPWRSEAGASRDSTGFREVDAGPVKSRGAGLAIALAALVLGGGAGAWFLFFKEKGDTAVVEKGSAASVATIDPGSSSKLPEKEIKPKEPEKDTGPAVMTDAQSIDALNAIQRLLAAGKTAESATAIKAFKAGEAPPAAKTALDNIVAAWGTLGGPVANLNDVVQRAAEVKPLLAKFPADCKPTFEDSYKAKLGEWLDAHAANADNVKSWEGLAEACQQANRTTLLAECWTEITLEGKTPKFPYPTISGSNELAAYVAVQKLAIDKEKPKAASLAVKLIGAEAIPTWLLNSPHRMRRLFDLFAVTAHAFYKPEVADLSTPFAKDDAANALGWLDAAVRLAPAAKIPTDELDRVKIERLLTLWVADPGDTALKSRADEVRQSEIFKTRNPAEAARIWAITAASRGNAKAERSQAMEAYSQILAIAKNSAAAVPPKQIHEWVLVPLGSPAFAKSLAVLDEKAKGDAATLLAATAANLRRTAETWNASKVLPDGALKESHKLFLSAAGVSGSARHFAWAGIVRFELDGKVNADDLNAMEKARNIGSAISAVDLYRAIVETDLARNAADFKARAEACGKARNSFKTAIDLAAQAKDAEQDELLLALRLGANNNIHWANYARVAAPESDVVPMPALAESVVWSRQLLTLAKGNAEAYDSLGCALEDQAWLLKDEKRFEMREPLGAYAQAEAEFGKAIDPKAGMNDDPLAIGALRAKAFVHRGRCRFKWAEDLATNRRDALADAQAKLAQAKADLREALPMYPEADVSFEKAECLFYLGEVAALQRDLESDAAKARELFDEALANYRASLKVARSDAARDWRPLAFMEFCQLALREIDAGRVGGDAQIRELLQEIDGMLTAELALPPAAPVRKFFAVKVLMLKAKNKLDAVDDKAVLQAAREGLDANANPQDRWTQPELHSIIGDLQTDPNLAVPEHRLALEAARKHYTALDRIAPYEGKLGFSLMQAGRVNPNERKEKWDEAFPLLASAETHAPNHPRAVAWRVTMANGYLETVKQPAANPTAEQLRRRAEAASKAIALFGSVIADGRRSKLPAFEKLADGYTESLKSYAKAYDAILKAALQDNPTTTEKVVWTAALAELQVFAKEPPIEREFRNDVLANYEKALADLKDEYQKRLFIQQVDRLKLTLKITS